MTILAWVAIGLVLLQIILSGYQLFLLKKNWKNYPIDPDYQPKVSVLIAARNEAKNISACVQALWAQNYPSHLFEVLIGDDASEDGTLQIANGLASQVTNVHVFDIDQTTGLRGKANVLAQLAWRATGEFFLIVDADVVVGPKWIRGLVAAFEENVAIVNGVTLIEGRSLWDKLNGLDWLKAIGLLKLATDNSKAVTAIGNNMAIRASVYQEVGGYEKIPFSLTEDLALFDAVCAKGYQANQILSSDAKGITKAPANFRSLLQQRKRWLSGAVTLRFSFLLHLFLDASVCWFLFLLLILNTFWGLLLSLLFFLMRVLFMQHLKQAAQIRLNYYLIPFYEMYYAVITLVAGIYFLLPTKTKWKGRKY